MVVCTSQRTRRGNVIGYHCMLLAWRANQTLCEQPQLACIHRYTGDPTRSRYLGALALTSHIVNKGGSLPFASELDLVGSAVSRRFEEGNFNSTYLVAGSLVVYDIVAITLIVLYSPQSVSLSAARRSTPTKPATNPSPRPDSSSTPTTFHSNRIL